MKLKKFLMLPAAVILGFSLQSCLNDDGDDVEIGNSYVSFINATPDTPAVDLYINSSKIHEGHFAFTDRLPSTSYTQTPATQYTMIVTPSDNQSVALFQSYLSLSEDIYQSVFLIDYAEDMKAVMMHDDLTSPASGMAKVRFANFSPDAPALSLAVASGDVWFDDYAFNEEDSDDEFVEKAADTYDFEVRDADSGEVLFTATGVDLQPGKTYTLWVKGLEEGTGERALGLETLEHVEITPTTP